MVIYGAQAMGIYLTVELTKLFQMDIHTFSYAMSVLKGTFYGGSYLFMRFLVQKRQASDQKNLRIRGMILVPVSA